MRAVQFCEPFSQLSMCVATSALPTVGPLSATSLPIRPAKFASMPSGLSLSHSRPRPLAGEGAFVMPVLVWPMRRTVQLPAGTSHTRRPFGVHVLGEVGRSDRGQSP